MENIFTNIKCSEIILSNANENWYIYFTTCFHGFAILRHVDPFVRILHIYICYFIYHTYMLLNHFEAVLLNMCLHLKYSVMYSYCS